MNDIEYPFFTKDELKCKCGKCGSVGLEMNPAYMTKIVALRQYLKFPLPITSAYRCPEYNAKVSTTGLHGPHTTGRAMDIAVRNEKAFQLIDVAKAFGFTGIGIQQKGDSRFVHIDDLELPAYPRPNVWSY